MRMSTVHSLCACPPQADGDPEPGLSFPQGEGVQQLREALKILAERVLILEHMIGVHGE